MTPATSLKSVETPSEKVGTKVETVGSSKAPVTRIDESELDSLLGDDGWESDAERSQRDWETLTNGGTYSEAFDSKNAASAFKAVLKTRSKKVNKTLRVKILDKDSDTPMVVFQFVSE